MRTKATTGIVVGGALLAAAALAGCSSGADTSAGTSTSSTVATTTAAAAAGAACTRGAILTAAKAATNLGSVQSVVNFGCAGSWAYANVTVGTGSAAFDAVVVLQAQGSTWVVADRANACNNHLVPAAIYTQACTTS